MSVTNFVASATASATGAPKAATLSATNYTTSLVASTRTAAFSTQVTISGKATMLSRLFSTDDPSADPVIHYSSDSVAQGVSVYSYLNTSDRAFVANLYEYAQQNGIDPIKVDAYAFDLGCYRSSEHILAYAPCDYDAKGNPIVRSFNATDEAVAQRIYTSKAFDDTGVNQGFLKYMLDPGWHPVHATDFQFLQQLVFAFSASGSDGAADPSAKPVVRPKASDLAPLVIVSTDASSSSTNGATLFEKYAQRVAKLSSWLTDNDKSLLGSMYSLAEQKGEKELKKVDGFAAKLAIAHMTEQLISGVLDGYKNEKQKLL